MATEDMYVEMYANFEMSFDEISEKIHGMVQSYMDFLRQDIVKDFHKIPAHKRRKHR